MRAQDNTEGVHPTDMDEFYSQWKDRKRAKGKKLERLQAFFNFCVKKKWGTQNPAEDLEALVGAGSAADKTPFTDAEIQAMYTACRTIGSVLAGQAVGIKEVEDGIWLVSFMDYGLGYIDLEEKTLQPLNNPFGLKVLPMS